VKVAFSSFRRRILRALEAAAEIGLSEELLRVVLSVGRQPPASNHVAGALAYLQRARLVNLSCAGSERRWTLTEKGAWELKNAANHPARRRRSFSPAAPPPSF
jgi:hypothetical protein